MPLETYVDQFTFTRFEPQGVVEGHPNVKMRDVDRRLHLPRARRASTCGRYDLAHVKPEAEEAAQHVGFLGGGRKEDRVSDSELPPPMSLSYTAAAVARSATEAESLEQPARPAAGTTRRTSTRRKPRRSTRSSTR